MKCGLELTKIILLTTVFLPNFACATEQTEDDSTAWYKLTSENIHTVPLGKLQKEYQEAKKAFERMKQWISETETRKLQTNQGALDDRGKKTHHNQRRISQKGWLRNFGR